MSSKFHLKRTFTEGSMQADLGVRSGDVRVRVHRLSDIPFHLTLDEAEDLADALDRLLASQEDTPVGLTLALRSVG